MSGIFGFFDVTRPGKGVSKNEEQKKGLALFGELLWRKLWKYIKLSLLYFATCIPTIVLITLFGMYAFSGQAGANPDDAYGWFLSSIMLALFSVVFFSGSPTHAGFAYILRNFVRQEHVWLWSDFWDRTKQNLKQAIAVYIIDLAVNFCLIISLNFYYSKLINGAETVYIVMSALFLLVTMLYAMMHDYIWTMMVTIDLSIKNLYKNAALFTLLGLGKNFISFALRIVLFAIVFGYLHTIAGYILYAVLLLSASRLLSQVYSYPYIKKYLIDPQMQTDKTEDDAVSQPEQEPEFDDFSNDGETVTPMTIGHNDVATALRFKNAENKHTDDKPEDIQQPE